jgi:hypothetical protein
MAQINADEDDGGPSQGLTTSIAFSSFVMKACF